MFPCCWCFLPESFIAVDWKNKFLWQQSNKQNGSVCSSNIYIQIPTVFHSRLDQYNKLQAISQGHSDRDYFACRVLWILAELVIIWTLTIMSASNVGWCPNGRRRTHVQRHASLFRYELVFSEDFLYLTRARLAWHWRLKLFGALQREWHTTGTHAM